MGCDIHFVTEINRGQGWEQAPDSLLGIEGWRDYMAFALLAGVRNYYGIVPIAEPKGHGAEFRSDDPYPDAYYSKENCHKYGWDGYDYHSQSWLTLREIEAYPWEKPRRQELEPYLKDSERNWADAEIKDNWVYKKLLPAMKKAAADLFLTPDNIRIVFCFDS